MLEQVLDKIGEPGVTVAAASPNSFAEEELVACRQKVEMKGRLKPSSSAISEECLRLRDAIPASERTQKMLSNKPSKRPFIHLNKFQGKSSFSTWLTRIAINEALMLVRRGSCAARDTRRRFKRPRGSLRQHWRHSMQVRTRKPVYLRRERVQILSETLGNLQPGLHLAIALRELAELSTEETARLVGISVAAVKARLFPCEKDTGQNNEVLHEITSDLRKRHPGRRR